jgi:hypothetical protein
MKRIGVLTAAVALIFPFAAAAAQQPAAGPITESFGAFAGRYAGWLRAAFDSIPPGLYGYKPTPAQQTVGYIAQHLEDANYQLCARFGGMTAPATARDSLADTLKAQWPKDTLVTRLKASFEFCQRAFETLEDAKLADQLPAGPPGSGRTVARARYVLAFVTDLVDHWSQIANYMRLNGMVPPSALPRPNP